MSRSKHSPDEKLQAVMESLDHNNSQAEICRRRGIFPTQLAKWKEQVLEGGRKGLSGCRHPRSGEEEIDDLKRMIGEQTLVINAFKNRLQGGPR